MAKDANTTEVDENKKKAAARSAAFSALRDAHREEYNDLLIEEMRKRGIDWTPRPSPEERAKAEIERLSKTFGINVQVVPEQG